MKNKFSRICLAASLSLAVMLPVFANSTQIAMNAVVDDFLIVQLERASDNRVVSGDDFHRNLNDPAANEILNFGTIDARGLSFGSLSSTNSLLPVPTLQVAVLDNTRKVYPVTNPPAQVDGALYYIKAGYQIRTVRSPGPTGELDTDVDVYNDGNIKTFVDLSSANTLSNGSTISSSSIRDAGSGVADKNELKPSVNNNEPFAIDIGLYVDNATPLGSRTTTITFTGT